MADAAENYPVSKIQYRPIEAAVRWSGLLQQEEQILAAYQRNDLPRATNSAQWAELKLNVERIFDALRHGELSPAKPDASVEDPDVTIRHVHLKAWMQRYFPGERPAFLFSELERATHPSITMEAVQVLLYERDSLKSAVRERKVEIDALRLELGKLLEERAETHAKQQAAARDSLSKRAETVLLNIIGGMLACILEKDGLGRPKSHYATQEALILALTERFGERLGMTKTTLENKFASGKRSLFGPQ